MGFKRGEAGHCPLAEPAFTWSRTRRSAARRPANRSAGASGAEVVHGLTEAHRVPADGDRVRADGQPARDTTSGGERGGGVDRRGQHRAQLDGLRLQVETSGLDLRGKSRSDTSRSRRLALRSTVPR